MVTLYMSSYNFVKPHRCLENATRAMAAEITEWQMTLDDLTLLVDQEHEANRPKKCGPYEKPIQTEPLPDAGLIGASAGKVIASAWEGFRTRLDAQA